jgi:hypothetical protein
MGTMELLLTMPITAWQAIVGKFLASWAFLALALFCTFPIILTVNYLGHPDNGVIFGAYVGTLLMAGAYLSISCMTSALTRNQVISFILSVVICLFLILAGWPPVTRLLDQFTDKPWLTETVASFSVMTHFESFQRGIIDIRDVVFYLAVMAFCLFTPASLFAATAQVKRRFHESEKKHREFSIFRRRSHRHVPVIGGIYIISNLLSTRIDLTQEKMFTLSPGTKAILKKLDTPVQIRFYASRARKRRLS